uniref:Protein kinase domain-containing protein n=1 Tax=Eutreptiella gymnastica TaxID=73025 RepID=A0A7S4G044_9EUGL
MRVTTEEAKNAWVQSLKLAISNAKPGMVHQGSGRNGSGKDKSPFSGIARMGSNVTTAIKDISRRTGTSIQRPKSSPTRMDSHSSRPPVSPQPSPKFDSSRSLSSNSSFADHAGQRSGESTPGKPPEKGHMCPTDFNKESSGILSTSSAMCSGRSSWAANTIREQDLKGWKRGTELGKGSFGQVWLGLLPNGKFVAVKEIEFGASTNEEAIAEEIQAELTIMRKLSHPNIVKYYGSEFLEQKLSIFLEYVPQGALSKVIKTFGPLQYVTAVAYTRQIIDGLVYLHTNNVIHRDIKCDNVLLDNNGEVKLTDFGCAKELARDRPEAKTVVGTPNFIAPEVIINGKYNNKADVWSLGCTCVEMITGKPPWPQFSTVWAALCHVAESEGPPGLPEDLDPDFREFLLQCFQRDVSKRPSSHQLLDMPCFLTEDSIMAPNAPHA